MQQQRAPEGLPLILEPVSRLHTSPVLVLDFQALYPSIMIAYNYCYSTCLGKVALYCCFDEISLKFLLSLYLLFSMQSLMS